MKKKDGNLAHLHLIHRKDEHYQHTAITCTMQVQKIKANFHVNGLTFFAHVDIFQFLCTIEVHLDST